MEPGQTISLVRDCEAVFIPSGQPTRLRAGTPVTLTQAAGGSYTVAVDGRLALIEGQQADALGLRPEAQFVPPAVAVDAGPVDEGLVWKQLKTCYDPELPVDIVELGLVYDLQVTPHPGGGSQVEVRMTLTAPGCGMGAMIAEDVQRKLLAIPGVTEARVELVWDPPWNQDMMTEAARLELGLM